VDPKQLFHARKLPTFREVPHPLAAKVQIGSLPTAHPTSNQSPRCLSDMTVDHSIDYQYMSKKSLRPRDGGSVVDIRTTSETAGLVILPNVRNFILIDNSAADGGEG